MRRSYAFLIIAVICFAIFAGSWFVQRETANLEYRSAERSLQSQPSETWLTLGNISGLCGIVSLMLQVWQWRRS
jgi:hypothetical protein